MNQQNTMHAAASGPLEPVVMCEYCDGTGEIEMDNNGPIVQCPLCSKNKTDEQFIKDSLQISMKNMDRAMVKNQCDGCARGLPVNDGIHRGDGYDLIGCTKHLYT